MPIYRFSIACTPTAGSARATDIKSADADVWVLEESMAAAEIKARSHLLDYAWVPTSIEIAIEPTPEQIERSGKDTQALHRKALQKGVASMLIASPKAEGQEDDPIRIRSMGAPLTPTDRKQ